MAKSLFFKLISSAAKAADKAVKEAEKERKRKTKEADKVKKKTEKDMLKTASIPTKVYGNIPKSNNKADTDTLIRSFRASDQNKWDNLDFVVGYKINRSNNKDSACKICEAGAGDYPKGFKWSGWHDGCMCFLTSILATNEEILKMEDNIIFETNIKVNSVNEIKDVPNSLKLFVANNYESCSSLEWFKVNRRYFD